MHDRTSPLGCRRRRTCSCTAAAAAIGLVEHIFTAISTRSSTGYRRWHTAGTNGSRGQPLTGQNQQVHQQTYSESCLSRQKCHLRGARALIQYCTSSDDNEQLSHCAIQTPDRSHAHRCVTHHRCSTDDTKRYHKTPVIIFATQAQAALQSCEHFKAAPTVVGWYS